MHKIKIQQHLGVKRF